MAYTHPTLSRIGGQNSDLGPVIWSYRSTDLLATVVAADYFLDAIEDLTLGDQIHAHLDTGGTPVYTLLAITALAAGTVTATAVVLN